MKRKTFPLFVCWMLLAAVSSSAALQLAQNGGTSYSVVRPDRPTAVDDYAVNALTNFLFQKTGAEFPVLPSDRVASAGRCIFVGLSEPVRKILGGDPLAGLADQEYTAQSVEDKIFLYGKGMHGNLHAVVDFMENTLGRRWYAARVITESPKWGNAGSTPTFTVEPDCVVEPFSRTGGFSFPYRLPYPEWLFDFHLQSGMNMFLSGRCNPNDFSLKVMSARCHTFFGYIPPSPDRQPRVGTFGWIEKKDYFATNPEYFSLWTNGKRVATKQLCFSNPGLRRELTKNILEHVRRLKADGQERLVMDVSAHDDVGAFCHCPECRELEQKYQSPGGPLYDYLFELCAMVKNQHPDTLIHTLAYRLAQTQKPPVLPDGMAFPDNLVIQFADVEANGDVDWNHPVNRPHYEDLLAWSRLTSRLWTWYYPFNGMIDRLVTDIRLMHEAGVEGVFVEFSGGNYNAAIDFTELQIHICNKLLRDVNADVPALIREFTDAHYGPAAEGARTYLREMESAWGTSGTNLSVSAGRGMSRRLTGVTPARMRRWQEDFDRMEKKTADDSRLHSNVRRLRRGLDYRTLEQWNDLTKAAPEYFLDHLVVKARLGDLPQWMVDQVQDWEMLIQTANATRPLPAPFDAMDPACVTRYVPLRGRRRPKQILDPDAAFGYGVVVDLPDKPFNFGFYQNDTKTHGARVAVNPEDGSTGSYRVYPLGEVQLTPNCIVWFSARSWVTQLQLGGRLYRPPSPDNDNRYDVHVSLKFGDPLPLAPRDAAQLVNRQVDPESPYSVLCDQIIFVRKAVDPGRANTQ